MTSFHTSNKILFLFRQWRTETLSEHIWCAVVMFLVAVTQEFLSAYLKYMLKRSREGETARCVAVFLSSLLYTITFIIRYGLMLALMGYSVPLFVAVVTGYGLGYFISQPTYGYLTDAEKGIGTREHGQMSMKFEKTTNG